MTTKLPPLNWLRTFEAAARLLNFTLAAQELNMTQSAVSQQIRLLEDYVGEPLFNRQPRKITLTKTGLAYLPVVQSSMHHLQRGTAEIFSPLKDSLLTLQVNTAYLLQCLTPRLHAFKAKYPSVRIQISHANWDSEFNNAPTELAIRHGIGNWPELHSHPLVSEKMYPYCTPDIAANLDTEVLSLIDVLGNEKNWDDWMTANDHGWQSRNQTRHKVDSAAAAVSLAEHGFGVCLTYEALVADQLETGKLVEADSNYVETNDSFFLTYPKHTPLSKTAQVFRDWLLEEQVRENEQ